MFFLVSKCVRLNVSHAKYYPLIFKRKINTKLSKLNVICIFKRCTLRKSYFFFCGPCEALRLLFRSGSCDLLEERVELMDLDFVFAVAVLVDGNDDDKAAFVRVGIRELAVCCLFILDAARSELSLSIFKFAESGDAWSETLLRFGNGVTLGDKDLDRLLFFAVGVNFFSCSTRCVGLLIWSSDCLFRVMMFLSLYSATSALRVRCTIVFSMDSICSRSSRTCACERRCRFLACGDDTAGDLTGGLVFLGL